MTVGGTLSLYGEGGGGIRDVASSSASTGIKLLLPMSLAGNMKQEYAHCSKDSLRCIGSLGALGDGLRLASEGPPPDYHIHLNYCCFVHLLVVHGILSPN